ncbi:alpha-N-arab-like proteininofuranosidase [Pseudovirgaria hyperparasitica]|uniref:Alpha-N-arab-like proteininofuranosidase n=1 Tax=Pseudovirgaria hyperparasitica TaxID=470096 RepID=A0A6A6VVE0_9PEZI|nr:alpha-N-arab-like proteininofuranosidase [Pseudovirgaria hyperparasitica]KAF2753756.1 alpha-N-arab-like proteininofuranosidase [Pseudovirgaria hyperparasitica]
MLFCALIATFASLAAMAVTQTPPMGNNATYMNPILDREAADPWVIRYDDWYYMIFSTNDNIVLHRSRILTDWRQAENKTIFTPEEGQNYSKSLWAPELHQLDDKWYVIFTADPRGDNPPPEIEMYCYWNCPAVLHRMFVLESSGSDAWNSDYSMKAELNTYDQFAIDGTYFKHDTGLYHIYSCWYQSYSAWPANLCIQKLSNPWTVETNFTERVVLSTPSEPWEKTPYGRQENDRLSSNEGPEQLVNPQTGQMFVIYSAARSDNRNYCLGQLELVGEDPMNVNDWKKHTAGCVFYQNALEKAYGVGHASFTTSPDGSESWIVYHGMRNPTNGWQARTVRAQKFDWNDDGSPKFPRPGYGPYAVASGEQ